MSLVEVLVGYSVFCGLSLLSRTTYPLFGLIVLIGIGWPLAWGKFTQEWATLGFSTQNLGQALLWGGGAGVLSSVMGVMVLKEIAIARDLGQQLLMGIPLWFLIISPFQEFFFRGWMQSKLEDSLGAWWGLLIANICFTLWHYVSPIVDMATFPLTTVAGALSTFVAGLAYGYTFQRSRNILSPWLGHTIAGVGFIIVGAMDFVQVMP
jgi:membrane protease YdiL (CAAX protease family)